MSWKPILDGDLAAAARESALAIAAALESTSPDGPSYAYGHAGLALFYGYLAAEYDDDRFADFAEVRLDAAVETLFDRSPPAGFFAGPTGVAWTNQHLQQLLSGEAAPDANEEIDEWIAGTVRSTPWQGDYDLLFGLAGLGCYALDHPDREFAARVIGSIVDRLEELAVQREAGLSWWTPSSKLFPADLKKFPGGYFNLGLAHGAPGVVGMLARACGENLAGSRARRLLDGAVEWLLTNKREDDGGSTFAPFVGAETSTPAASCRSAWCYGDPGVAAALLGAARAVGAPDWEREAVAIALKDCTRPMHDRGVVDATLCHGAAGLGHLYNRFYQATGEETFGRVARDWFEHALSMRRPGLGIAGFSSWWDEAGEWRNVSGFLEGAAGISLALIAATSHIEPGWDRPMLLAIPPKI
ncbi:MAG TPA: lanthionine synthetase C family protein [Thermoanaerobaculia bacterium]|jgi:lantibiotic modifying enzyme|nr:lanthionine synthetase C family protein [Thermoanaerobaculia bacterium]